MKSYILHAELDQAPWDRLRDYVCNIHGYREEENLKYQLVECLDKQIPSLKMAGFFVEIAPHGTYEWSSNHFVANDGDPPLDPEIFWGDYLTADEAVNDSKPGHFLAASPVQGYSVFPPQVIPHSVDEGRVVNWPFVPGAIIPDFTKDSMEKAKDLDHDKREKMVEDLINEWIEKTIKPMEEEAAKDPEFGKRPWPEEFVARAGK